MFAERAPRRWGGACRPSSAQSVTLPSAVTPIADSLRSKLTAARPRAAICRSWRSAPDRGGSSAREVNTAETPNSPPLPQLWPFGCGYADVRGATASGASTVAPREEGESCSCWRGHFSSGQSANNRVIQPAEQPAGQTQPTRARLAASSLNLLNTHHFSSPCSES